MWLEVTSNLSGDISSLVTVDFGIGFMENLWENLQIYELYYFFFWVNLIIGQLYC